MPDDRETNLLIRDLKTLRQREGYRMAKLRSLKHILNLPAVRDAGPTDDDRVVVAASLIFEAVTPLSKADSRVAEAMLGLEGFSGATLDARLRSLGGSLDTTRDHMDRVTEELAHQLYKVGHVQRTAVTSARPVLRYARDVRSHHLLQPLVEAEARLSGWLTKVQDHGRICFLYLRDTTGSIQLIATRDALDDSWEAVKGLRATDRITAAGRIGLSQSGELSVMLSEPPIMREKNLETSIAQGEVDYARVGAQILGARLRERAAEFFRAEQFVEIEPTLISASWRSPGLEPLRVQYPGFGMAAYLAPSPASQLLDALVATGVDRIFAVSRCFSTTHRDEKSSAESLILVAKALDLTRDNQRDMLRRAIVEILGDLETLPEEIGPLLTEWQQHSLPWPPETGATIRSTPTFEIFANPSPLGQGEDATVVNEICRAIWPPNRVIGESAHERLDGNLEVATTTLHLERMVSLLRDVPIRQLRHLGRTAESLTEALARAENDKA